MTEWITGLEAVKRLGGDLGWLSILAHRAQLGIVRTQADAYFVNGERQGDGPSPIPARFWKLYNLEGTWRTGDFTGGGNPFAKDPSRFEVIGAKFAADDVEALGPHATEVETFSAAISERSQGAALSMVSNEAAPLEKWRGTDVEQFLPDMHAIAAMVRERRANTLHRAAKLLVRDRYGDLTVEASEVRAMYLYKKTREIYRDDGQPKAPSARS